jgi:DNA-binding CsgD family transcriptional regulator
MVNASAVPIRVATRGNGQKVEDSITISPQAASPKARLRFATSKGSARKPTPASVLASQLVALLTPQARADLALVVNASTGIPVSAVPDVALDELLRTLGPLLQLNSGSGILATCSSGVRKELQHALHSWCGLSHETDAPGRIREAILNRSPDAALSIFAASGGVFFAHVHGVEISRRVVNSFPEGLRRTAEVLRLAEAINAMKTGHIAHAKSLLVGIEPAAATLASLCSVADSVSVDLICCRMVIGVCDEEPIEHEVLELLFRVLERLPVDSAMRRGMLYNVALDAFVRAGQWEAAHESALQARYHFTNARAQLAVFYIDLYLALIDLVRGDIRGARATLAAASTVFEGKTPHSDNDQRLLRALQGICEYELGDAKPLAELVTSQMRDGGFGELWPSIAGPLIAYGTRALASCETFAAAKAYLERWRLQQWRSERFAAEIAVAELELLQLAERWHSADEAYEQITEAWQRQSYVATTETAAGSRLEFHLRTCRAAIETSAADAGLQVSFDALLSGNRLTARQRIAVLIWAAAAAAEREDWNHARSLVAELADCVESTGIVGVLLEQRSVLRKLLESREARKRLATSAKASMFFRTCSRFSDPQTHEAVRGGLTRQEARILMLLVEGVPNKTIARRLDLALPTVRFHLKNLYRKMGAASRKDVVAAADGIGLAADPTYP